MWMRDAAACISLCACICVVGVRARTCSAIRSRKFLPSFTVSNDLAFSRPMDVPRPPLSLSTAVAPSRSAAAVEVSGFFRSSYIGSSCTRKWCLACHVRIFEAGCAMEPVGGGCWRAEEV